MPQDKAILGIFAGDCSDEFQPLATVVNVDPETDDMPTPSFWMTAVLSPLDGQAFAELRGDLNRIVFASKVSSWAIRFPTAEPVIFDGFIKQIFPDLVNGRVTVEFRLNGPPR
jgi:hypothetical protein